MKYIIFDIDGVLADNRHRLHHIQKEPKDWEAFFADMDKDGLIASGMYLLHTIAYDLFYRSMYRYKVGPVYLTGRPERYRPATERWLRDRVNERFHALFMRQDDDHRPDHVFKAEKVRQLGVENILFAIDDSPEVCEAYRKLGIPTFQFFAGGNP